MRSFRIVHTMLISLLIWNCAGKIKTGQTNVTDMPKWYNNYREYKYYDPDNKVYGRGFGENILRLSSAMILADADAKRDLAAQVSTFMKSSETRKDIINDVISRNTGNRRSSDNINVQKISSQMDASTSFKAASSEILNNIQREISDQREVKGKDGNIYYRAWALWSISKDDIKKTYLQKVLEDPDLVKAIDQVYSTNE